jgi:hypothetical protein
LCYLTRVKRGSRRAQCGTDTLYPPDYSAPGSSPHSTNPMRSATRAVRALSAPPLPRIHRNTSVSHIHVCLGTAAGDEIQGGLAHLTQECLRGALLAGLSLPFMRRGQVLHFLVLPCSRPTSPLQPPSRKKTPHVPLFGEAAGLPLCLLRWRKQACVVGIASGAVAREAALWTRRSRGRPSAASDGVRSSWTWGC